MNNEDKDNNTAKPATKPAQLGQKKVFDVVRPGKAPASATSRPVIVGHKPPVKDDQLLSTSDSQMAGGNPLDDDRSLMSHKKGGLKLDAPAAMPDDADTETDRQEQGQGSAVDAAPSEAQTAETIMPPAPDETVEHDIALTPESNGPDTTTQSSSEGPSPTESTKTEQPVAGSDAPEVFAMDRPAKTEETGIADADSPGSTEPEQAPITTEELIAATGAPTLDHTIISHHKTKAPWWEWLLIFLLIVIVGLAAFNFLLDAEVIKINVDLPHTNLIK